MKQKIMYSFHNVLKKEMSFGEDFLVIVINAGSIIIGVFLLNAYIGRIHGTKILGEHLLIRRTVYSAIGIFLIEMNIGLPYYIAKGSDNFYDKLLIITFIFISVPLLLVFTILIKIIIVDFYLLKLVWFIFIYTVGARSIFVMNQFLSGTLIGNFSQRIKDRFESIK